MQTLFAAAVPAGGTSGRGGTSLLDPFFCPYSGLNFPPPGRPPPPEIVEAPQRPPQRRNAHAEQPRRPGFRFLAIRSAAGPLRLG
jgi:hypothetical protein